MHQAYWAIYTDKLPIHGLTAKAAIEIIRAAFPVQTSDDDKFALFKYRGDVRYTPDDILPEDTLIEFDVELKRIRYH